MKNHTLALLSSFTLAACNLTTPGKVIDGASTSGLPSFTQKSQALKYTCKTPELRGKSNPAMKKLTKAQLKNTLTYVLGSDLASDPEIQEDVSTLPDEAITATNDQLTPVHDAGYAKVINKIADRLVKLTTTDANARKSLFGACVQTTPLTSACVDSFLASFGTRAFRRPLNPAELAKYKQIYTAQGANLNGLQSLFYVLFQSPTLAFMTAFGEQEVGEKVRLSDYEVASRISYSVLDMPPDAELMRAAAIPGELQKIERVRFHVNRLLNPKSLDARARVIGIMRFYTGVSEKEAPSSILGEVLGVKVSDLALEMLQEYDDFASHVFWSGGTYVDLMTSQNSFPRSETMKQILGAGSLAKADEPALASESHLGLLHRPAFLQNAGHRSSPILRGAHIRNHILCDNIPFPSQEAVDERLNIIGDVEDHDNKTRTIMTTASNNCIGCHVQINDLGFPFESFDQFGAIRTQEMIYDDEGKLVTTWPIATTAEVKNLDGGFQAAVAVSDSQELARVLANGSKARACYAKKLVEFTQERKSSVTNDSCTLSDVEVALRDGSLKDAFVNSIANEDIFWRN